MSTLGIIPGGGTSNESVAVAALDNGDVWCLVSWTPNPTQQNYLTYDPSMTFIKATPTHFEIHSEAMRDYQSNPDDPPEGPISTSGWGGLDVIGVATDGQAIYGLGFSFQIKKFDPVTKVTSTLAGPNPADPTTWSGITTIKDSHTGFGAKLGYLAGGIGIDRTNRYLYFFARTSVLDSFQRGVGGYLRRMSLDGEHPVETLGWVSEVTHHTSITIHGGRVWFGTRQSSLGPTYQEGGFGIGSTALDGTDFRLHFIDSDILGASKHTGFSSHKAALAVINDTLLVKTPAGAPKGGGGQPRSSSPDIVGFPMASLLTGTTIVHDHTNPIFEVVVRGLQGGPYHMDGLDPLGSLYLSQSWSAHNNRLYILGLNSNPYIINSFDGWYGVSLRVLQPSADLHRIKAIFSGTALKGYSAKFEIQRTPELTVDLQ